MIWTTLRITAATVASTFRQKRLKHHTVTHLTRLFYCGQFKFEFGILLFFRELHLERRLPRA